MAFSNEMIRAIVKTGRYSDPAAEKHLADVLIKRRDKIGEAHLPAVNPLVDFRLDESGVLTFDNAAVSARVATAPPGGYEARWYRFDNSSGTTAPIGSPVVSRDLRIQGPAGFPTGDGEFVKVEVAAVNGANASWSIPVQVFFRRIPGRWKLVGLQRMPDERPRVTRPGRDSAGRFLFRFYTGLACRSERTRGVRTGSGPDRRTNPGGVTLRPVD
jgi:hypothetical protein